MIVVFSTTQCGQKKIRFEAISSDLTALKYRFSEELVERHAPYLDDEVNQLVGKIVDYLAESENR